MQRWNLEIQSFDVWIEHIAGGKDVVADGLSRLCNNRGQSTLINLLYSYSALEVALTTNLILNWLAPVTIDIGASSVQWRKYEGSSKRIRRAYLAAVTILRRLWTVGLCGQKGKSVEGPPISEKGNEHILAMVDHLAVIVSSIRLGNLQHIKHSWHGINRWILLVKPLSILTDNMSQFQSRKT